MPSIPIWRLALAALVLGALIGLGILIIPVYVHNAELQSFAQRTALDSGSLSKPDDLLKAEILNRAESLNLPIRAGDVRIVRSGNGVRVGISYVVKVNLPLYTVDLHFH